MTDAVFNLDLHKIPSKQIRQSRREFYSLWRRSDDKTTTWLRRVRNCIRRCEFPRIILEFLLFDRFTCELDSTELKSIQKANKSWTLNQLLEYYLDGNVVSGEEHFESGWAVDDTLNRNENELIDVVKSEPVCLHFVHLLEFIHKKKFEN